MTLDELYDKAETSSKWLKIKDAIYNKAIIQLRNEDLILNSDNVIKRQEVILCQGL